MRDDIEIEDPRPGHVRVRVRHCGVCHSDLSLADGVFPTPTPIILGHEAAGVVDALGRMSTAWRSATPSSSRRFRPAASATGACAASRASA